MWRGNQGDDFGSHRALLRAQRGDEDDNFRPFTRNIFRVAYAAGSNESSTLVDIEDLKVRSHQPREESLEEAAMHNTSIVQPPSLTLASGVAIPDSKMAREITELVRDTENSLLFNHSSRVYYFSAATGIRKGLTFDSELLYVSAMFHDMGLTPKHSSAEDRFEVDGANTAREFLRQHKIPQQDIDTVWTAIALHTTPGIPQYMHPVVALLTNGVEMDVLGIAYPEFSDADREAIVAAYPRTEHFKEDIIEAFYQGIKHKPETTFGNVKADVLADKDAKFQRMNFCNIIRGSQWKG
jgi:HD domain